MRKTNPNLIDDTITVWQRRSSRRLSREDAREITENLPGYFAILAEWSRKEGPDPATADHAKVTVTRGADA